MHPRLACLVVVCLLMAASSILAQVPETMTIQGRLTNAAGDPVAAGNKTFDFRIYKSETTTAQTWPGYLRPDEVIEVYTDADGFWTAEIGTINPLTPYVFHGDETWLEIRVSVKGGLPEILPRIRLFTSPFSFRVGSVDDAQGGTIVSDLEIEGTLSLGNTSTDGQLDLHAEGFADPVVTIDADTGLGGRIVVRDTLGNEAAYLATGNGSDGGILKVWSDAANIYCGGVDGSYLQSSSPYLWLNGVSKGVALYSDLTGNGSVNLGSDAVSDYEIYDEPGVAFNGDNIGHGIGSTWTTFEGRTMTIPDLGYIIAIGTFSVNAQHTSGTTTRANFALCQSTAEITADMECPFQLSSAAPTGSYYFPMTVTYVFRMSTSGIQSFYIAAEETSGTVVTADVRLTLLYVPTAYGDVTDLGTVASTSGDEIKEGGLTQAEIEREQADARAFHDARLAEELADMRVRMDELERRLEADGNSSANGRE